MHLIDAFIQSIQAIHFFCQYVCSLGIEPTTFCVANAMLWATETHLAVDISMLTINYALVKTVKSVTVCLCQFIQTHSDDI